MLPRPDASATRTLAWLYCTATQRPLLAALCGLETEIGASLRPGLDHEVAHARLAWWREECARGAAGNASHPLLRAAADCFPAGGPVALAGVAGLVDTAVWDLAAATFQTRRELDGYCARWAEAMIAPLVGLARPGGDRAAALGLGAALRELEMLCALERDASAGRLRLPLDELAAAGVAPEALARPPWPAALVDLLAARHAQLRRGLAAALRSLGAAAQPPLRGLMVWVALAAWQSQRAVRCLPQPAGSSEQRAPLAGWRAWRSARRAARGRFGL